MSPQARTRRWLEEQGYEVGLVERWIPRANVRKDLFGFIDLVAMNKLHIWGVQACAFARHNDHVAKALAAPLLSLWLHVGKFDVISWRKLKASGWTRRQTMFMLGEDNQPVAIHDE